MNTCNYQSKITCQESVRNQISRIDGATIYINIKDGAWKIDQITPKTWMFLYNGVAPSCSKIQDKTFAIANYI